MVAQARRRRRCVVFFNKLIIDKKAERSEQGRITGVGEQEDGKKGSTVLVGTELRSFNWTVDQGLSSAYYNYKGKVGIVL